MPEADSDTITSVDISNPCKKNLGNRTNRRGIRVSEHKRLREAKDAAREGRFPPRAFKAFSDQFYMAKGREIPFLFSWEEWWNWWLIDGRWEERGLIGDGFVMARFGDVGPYSPDNVYCARQSQNTKDIDRGKKSIAIKSGLRKLKESGWTHPASLKRGDEHHTSRAVLTPEGRFGSAALAGEHCGITRRAAALRATNRTYGWRWEDGVVMPASKPWDLMLSIPDPINGPS